MEPQTQQPTQLSEKSKKKFYKKWWFWVLTILVVFILAGFIYAYLGLRLPCGYLLGGGDLPCTDVHQIDESVTSKLISTHDNLDTGSKITAIDTEVGVIYEKAPCGMVFDACDVYYNAHGEYIASCNGMCAELDWPFMFLNGNKNTCDWINEQFKSSDRIYIKECF